MSKNTENIVRSLPTGYLSVSQINCFLQCGYKYFYRYVLGIKTAPGLALVYGKAGHHVLEENSKYFLDTGTNLELEELTTLFNEYFDTHKTAITDWNGTTADKVKKDAAGLLRLFHSTYASMFKPYRDGIERKVETVVSGIPMLGYIDFVGMFNRAETVLDYKFVGRAKSRKDVAEDIQLTFYSMVSGIKDVRFVSFIKPHPRYHPRPDIQVIAAKRTEKDTEEFIGLVSKTALAISQRKFRSAERGHYLCNTKYCEFWDRCPSGGCPGATVPGRQLEDKEKSKNTSLEEILED